MPEEKPPHDEPALTGSESGDSGETVTTPKSNLPPGVILAFVIIALLGVLIVMVLKGGAASHGPVDNQALSNLQAEYNALRAEYNNERIAMGLRPVEGNSEPIEDIAGRLKKDADSLVAMATSYQKMLSEKDAELSARNAEILRGEKIRASLAAESTRLQGELQRALVSGSDADLLRRNQSDLKAQRDALASELDSVRQQLKNASAGASADDFNELKRRFEETRRAKDFFEARVKELEGDLSKVKLFASSENELLPAAVELFRDLRLLEGKADSEISTSYSMLGAKLGANVLRTLSFATGKSEVSLEDHAAIQKLVDDVPDGDLIMAIGYASETGNLDSNQSLSSARATAAAQLITSMKRPGQLAQGVYLGQTDRFSSRIPERNQIVEIWQIRKK
jgi:outer membrane protein OmpA-like peptidoglycan-associated protein